MSIGKQVLMVNPRGFCAGVRHAVEMIETALRCCPPPVYCLKELVHNIQVIDDLKRRGVRFVADVEAVPCGATLMLGAHGVPPSVRENCRRRRLRVLDATCPFVTRLHNAVWRYAQGGNHVLVVGHRDHDEIIGVCGEAPEMVTVVADRREAAAVLVPDPSHVAAVTQTTLDVDETNLILKVLRSRFPALQTSPQSDICFATHNRQKAASEVAGLVDAMLVLGSANSSNTNRLVEVCRREGQRAELVCDVVGLDKLDLEACNVLGLTAGASTPDVFVLAILERLRNRGFTDVVEHGTLRETVQFALPRALGVLQKSTEVNGSGKLS